MSEASQQIDRHLLIGNNATWKTLSHCLQALARDESETQNLLITFSGLGCCLPLHENSNRATVAKYQQAICLHDQPVTPSMLAPLLKGISKRYERVVLLLDAAFCNVEGENGDTKFFRDAMAGNTQAEYAPAADPTLLEGIESTMDPIDLTRNTAEERFDQLSAKAGVEVLLADACLAWETSDNHERFDRRKWQGVFSFAAQNSIQFGPEHWPWNNLGVTERLIPKRYFPQRPLLFKPKKSKKPTQAK